MDELSKEYVISFFDRTLDMYGDTPEAVRWTPKGQALRYECLLNIDDDIRGKRVLDFGCGKGDFYQFLKERNIDVRYTGFDINERLIKLARKKFGQCNFTVFDIDKDILTEEFDYIFLCGVFNLKLQDLNKSIKKTLKTLFHNCRIALAFNALSAHDPKKAVELHYISPGEILDYVIKNLSPFVRIVHDRVHYDFTLFIRRDIKN